MRIPKIPYLKLLPLLALVFAAPALADESEAVEQQIAADLRRVAAFEQMIERRLEDEVERTLSARISQEFERQNERLARL